jgi:hypothetical protein
MAQLIVKEAKKNEIAQWRLIVNQEDMNNGTFAIDYLNRTATRSNPALVL